MSGYKRSEIRLDPDGQRKIRLRQEIGDIEGEVDALRERMKGMLEEASEGLISNFETEVKQVENWLETSEVGKTDEGGSTSKLEQMLKGRQRLLSKGRELHQMFTDAFTRRADRAKKRLTKKLAEVERLSMKQRKKVKLWFGSDQTEKWDDTLYQIGQTLERDGYSSAREELEQIEKEINHKNEQAEQMEEKHQQRLYVLKALRQVCAELGFRNVSGPDYVEKGERGSRIKLTVVTLNRGKITFYLALDEINSVSDIADNHCLQEFGQLSEDLKDKFGVHTDFAPTDPDSGPRLSQGGKMEMPAGREAIEQTTERAMARHG